MRSLALPRGSFHKPASGYVFQASAPTDVYLVVHQRGGYKPPAGWKKTGMTLQWSTFTDVVYKKRVDTGSVEIPNHSGKQGSSFGLPHLVFVADKSVKITAPKQASR